MKNFRRSAIGLSFLIALLCLQGCGNDLKVGDTWVYEINTGNPFENPVKFEYEILDIKNDYVLFKDKHAGQVRSERVRYFLIGSSKKT